MHKLKHITQKENDYSCGLVCVQMILNSIGIDENIEGLLKLMKSNPNDTKGVYPSELVSLLGKFNIPSRLLFSHSYMLEHNSNNFSQGEKIAFMKKWIRHNSKHQYVAYAKHLLDLLISNGKVEHVFHSAEYWQKLLNNNSVLIITVNLPDLYGKKKFDKQAKYDSIKGSTHEGHFVVITEYKNSQFKVYDPYPSKIKGREGIYWIDADILLNACIIWRGNVIEVKLNKN